MIQASRTYQNINQLFHQMVMGLLPKSTKLTPSGEIELAIRIDDLVAFIAKIQEDERMSHIRPPSRVAG